MSYWVTPNITLIITGRAGLAWQTDWYLVRTPLYSHLQLLQLNPPSALLLLCKALNSFVTHSEEWRPSNINQCWVALYTRPHYWAGLTCCLTPCYSGLSWYKWGMMVLLATCQQYNYTSPPPYWDNDRWCRYCVCRQMDKNMREPRWKVSRLGFDNFIMTSQACFVVITGRPGLWLDLYCDRHLTPRTYS